MHFAPAITTEWIREAAPYETLVCFDKASESVVRVQVLRGKPTTFELVQFLQCKVPVTNNELGLSKIGTEQDRHAHTLLNLSLDSQFSSVVCAEAMLKRTGQNCATFH